jgi:hypothetical protein
VNASLPSTLLLEKHFWDGRRAQVVRVGSDVLARVYTASGKVYLEHPFSDIGEATTTILEWNGDGWPQPQAQQALPEM